MRLLCIALIGCSQPAVHHQEAAPPPAPAVSLDARAVAAHPVDAQLDAAPPALAIVDAPMPRSSAIW